MGTSTGVTTLRQLVGQTEGERDWNCTEFRRPPPTSMGAIALSGRCGRPNARSLALPTACGACGVRSICLFVVIFGVVIVGEVTLDFECVWYPRGQDQVIVVQQEVTLWTSEHVDADDEPKDRVIEVVVFISI